MPSMHAIRPLVTSLVAVLALTSCGHDDARPATTGNAVFNNAISSVTASLAGVGGLMPSVAFAPRARRVPRTALIESPRTGLAGIWAGAATIAHPACSGGASDPHCQAGSNQVNAKDYMGYQIDPDAERDNGSAINIFGRINSSLSIACAIMNLAPNVDASTGYPSNGTFTVTFTSSSASVLTTYCGFSASNVPSPGESVSITTSTPADTSVYDKKMVITLDANMGGGTQTFYLRTNSSAINILSAELNSDNLSRNIIAYDRTTRVGRAEYISGPNTIVANNGGTEFQRLYIDETNDVASMLSYSRDFNSMTVNRMSFSLVGKPATAGSEVAVSMRAEGYGGLGYATIYKGCVNSDTGALSGDDTSACAGGVTGRAMDNAGITSIVSDLDTNVYNSGTDPQKLVHSSVITDTLTLSYSNNTIFTTAVAHQ
jgi:hypothetical protein